ncbi:hypothetical protein STVIR_6716 [Streptomyces viridochromogenes Tue57]|uniref:Uncharacterized protein n=1 Tax=Streptomyces viridochromogenes Tue57 TaxID=1160705 RepID=L8P839_STRVR|nr:hypothetical protein STVIR_6716 [Streptomyces viridochromogenes Tue57]
MPTTQPQWLRPKTRIQGVVGAQADEAGVAVVDDRVQGLPARPPGAHPGSFGRVVRQAEGPGPSRATQSGTRPRA